MPPGGNFKSRAAWEELPGDWTAAEIAGKISNSSGLGSVME